VTWGEQTEVVRFLAILLTEQRQVNDGAGLLACHSSFATVRNETDRRFGEPRYEYHLTPHNLGFMAIDRLADASARNYRAGKRRH